MPHPSPLLLVFVKHPRAGEVKTRLAKDIGDEKALAVYQDLLAHTAQIIAPLQATIWIGYGNEVPTEDLWSERSYPRFLQSGDDLGQRMCAAFEDGFNSHFGSIVIIGSDCPTLTTDILEAAFEALSTHDMVMGPAWDGGYYLMGMNALFKNVFLNKKWSTSTVLEDTVSDIISAGLTYFTLPTLRDIDTAADLQS